MRLYPQLALQWILHLHSILWAFKCIRSNIGLCLKKNYSFIYWFIILIFKLYFKKERLLDINNCLSGHCWILIKASNVHVRNWKYIKHQLGTNCYTFEKKNFNRQRGNDTCHINNNIYHLTENYVKQSLAWTKGQHTGKCAKHWLIAKVD